MRSSGVIPAGQGGPGVESPYVVDPCEVRTGRSTVDSKGHGHDTVIVERTQNWTQRNQILNKLAQ